MMRVRLFFTSFVASLLCACVALPPSMPSPTALDVDRLHIRAPAAEILSNDWWVSLHDAQLNQLMARALDKNPSLTEAIARLTRARADVSAITTSLRPQVEATANLSRDHFSEAYIYPPPYGGGSWWNGQVGFGAHWDPDFWGRQRAVIQAATHGANARAFDVRSARSALQSALLDAYLDLDQQYQLLALTEAYESDRQQIVSLIKRRLEAGLDSEVEQTAANALLIDARLAHRQVSVLLELREHQIRSLLGAEQDLVISQPSLDYREVLVLPSVIPGDLLLRRADVLAALERVEATSSQEAAAKRAFYPDINISGYIGFTALTLPDLISAPSRQYGVGPSLSLPIFDAGRLRAQLLGSRADLNAAVAHYNATVLRAVQEVADQLTQVKALEREVQDQSDKLLQIKAAQTVAERRAASGLTGQLPVLEADIRQLLARMQYTHSRTLQGEAHVALVLSIGTGNALISPSPSQEKAHP